MEGEQRFEAGVGIRFKQPPLEAGDEELQAAVLRDQQRNLLANPRRRRARGSLPDGDLEVSRLSIRASPDAVRTAEGLEDCCDLRETAGGGGVQNTIVTHAGKRTDLYFHTAT